MLIFCKSNVCYYVSQSWNPFQTGLVRDRSNCVNLTNKHINWSKKWPQNKRIVFCQTFLFSGHNKTFYFDWCLLLTLDLDSLKKWYAVMIFKSLVWQNSLLNVLNLTLLLCIYELSFSLICEQKNIQKVFKLNYKSFLF